MRRAANLDRLQTDEAADAVIDVHHQIAGGQAGRFGNEIVGAPHGAARPHQPVAENILLADNRRFVGLEAGFDAEHRQRHGVLGQAERLRPGADRRQIVQFVIGEHVAHALARALAPQCDRHPLARRLPRQHVFAHRLEHIGARLGALGCEVVAGARVDIDNVSGWRHGELRQPRQRRGLKPLLPLRLAQIEPVHRQRLVGRRHAVLERLAARIIVIRDLRETFVRGVFRQRLERERGARQIVEDRL